MHFVIVEDLKADRDTLTEMVRKDCAAHGEDAGFSAYACAEDFLAEFRRGFCSAVFLDIVLGDGMTGIEAAGKVRELDEDLPIIFTTTEPDFALESYGVHALDYLLKPVQPDKLSWCMRRLRGALASPEYLEVREVDERGKSLGLRCVLLKDITDTETLRRGCVIHTAGGDVLTSLTHGELMSLVPPPDRFFEYSRGTCVHFSFVVSISQEGEILMKDGRRLYCSRRKVKDTIEAWRRFRFAQLRAGFSGEPGKGDGV